MKLRWISMKTRTKTTARTTMSPTGSILWGDQSWKRESGNGAVQPTCGASGANITSCEGGVAWNSASTT